jgi:hypothetical protein
VATPPANDSCANPAVLPLNTTVFGTTLGALPDYQGNTAGNLYTGTPSCNDTFPGREVVYQFTTTTAGQYTLRLSPERGSDTGLALLSACTNNSCLVTEDPGFAGEVDLIGFTATATTTYFVVVDSYSNSSNSSHGGFLLSVSN